MQSRLKNCLAEQSEKTCYATNSSLSAHAGLVTILCEAAETMYLEKSRRTREGKPRTANAKAVRGLGLPAWLTYVNCYLNVVIIDGPKALLVRWNWSSPSRLGMRGLSKFPAERQNLTWRVFQVKHGKPISLPSNWQADRK